ncbi:MAG: chromosomal replication initiator protein DnaA [Bdellovibrionota bacterium]
MLKDIEMDIQQEIFPFDSLEKQPQGSQEAQDASNASPDEINRYSGKVVTTQFGEALTPKYSFDTFVVGKSNQFAHASAVATANRPGIYNPLFIVGKTGLGKTHLLKAIGYRILSEVNPTARICYRSTQKFIEEVIQSIRHDTRHELHERYQLNCDVLLMDDIQFLSRSVSTQDEFFRIFNSLFDGGKQIVITSDRMPKEIQDVNDRIISRFEMGMVADIDAPELETRVAILKARAEADKITLADEVAHLIATYVKANIRELEGCLTKLAAHAAIYNEEISASLVKKILKGYAGERQKVITLDEIISVVSHYFSVKSAEIRGPSRKAPVAKARQIVMYMGRGLAKLSCTSIAEDLGNRHHTTVLHGQDYVEKAILTDPVLKAQLQQIEETLTKTI